MNQKSDRVGVLLVNTGSPDSPHPLKVYRYLNQFLLDPRVIDLPVILRQLLVCGFLVPFRFRKSAKNYAAIWTKEGSPLLVNSRLLRDRLQKRLPESYQVALGMRYGTPSIEEGLSQLTHCRKILLFPLFPQYASATTGSACEEAMRVMGNTPVQIVPSFASDPFFIDAWADVASQFDFATYDHILFSFHGLPMRQINKAKYCYQTQCEETAFAIANKCQIPATQFSICYQSRLGPEKWIGPSCVDRLTSLAKMGAKKLLTFAPSFVADCLETTYEIGIEYRELFRHHGGHTLDLVPSLNAHPTWVEGLSKKIQEEK